MIGGITMIAKLIAPAPKPENYTRYLFIGPHPDDIEIGAGATAVRLAAEGKEVHFLILTDGCYGSGALVEKTKEEVVAIRRAEAEKAAAIIGAKSVTILSFSDGGMYKTEDLAVEIAKVASRFKPEVIFCPDHKLKTEGHADHLKGGLAASLAFVFMGNELMMKDIGAEGIAEPKALAYYYTDKPNRFVKVSKYIKTQLTALAEHKSQVEIDVGGGKSFHSMMKLYFTFRAIRFGVRSLKGKAEGFRVIAPIHSHCFAEKF